MVAPLQVRYAATVTTSPPRERHGSHERIAAELARASDDELLDLLSDPRLLKLGHATVHLPRGAGTASSTAASPRTTMSGRGVDLAP